MGFCAETWEHEGTVMPRGGGYRAVAVLVVSAWQNPRSAYR